MRTINEFLNGNEKVWFYLGEDLKKQFAIELLGMGFAFLNGIEITTDRMSRIISVHADGKITHVSLMVQTVGFKPGDGSCGARHAFYHIPKVDYAKYVAGDSDYLMTECIMTRIS